MRTLPSVVAIATIATLLAGCSNTPGASSEADPQSSGASASGAASSTTPSSSAASSSTPTSGAASSTTPAAPSPAPTTPAPSPVPTTAAPTTPVPTTPAPSPAPTAPVEQTPAVPAVPAAPGGVVVPTTPDFGGPSTSIPQGGAFTIVGSGYEPGQQVIVSMGYYRTDSFVMDDQTAIADAAGNYSLMITVGPDLEARTYGILTYEADAREQGDPAAFEASKQYATIKVVAA